MILSVIIICKNEENTIKTCLESVKWADEIIIADNGSTDNTLEIAKKYTDKIISFKDRDFSELRSLGFKKSTGEWVLYVDADERVLKNLRDEVLEVIKEDKKSAFAISRRNIIFGEEVSYGPYKHDWVIRLIKRSDFMEWVGKVHEYPRFKGELGYLKNPFLHLTHRNIDHFVLKSLDWSNIDARLRLDAKHPKMTYWRFLRILFSELFVQLIKRRGLMGGTVGVIDSVMQAFFLYMSYVRLWELQQRKPLFEKYKEIDEKLVENEFRF